jgi:hypothetical protein
MTGRARFYAILSAACSLGFLLGLAAAVLFLFVNWKVSLVLLGSGILLGPAAKFFDRMKSRWTWGRKVGDAMHVAQWETGRKNPIETADIEASMLRDYGPIFEKYGYDLDEETATVFMCVHRLLDAGEGEWQSVVETDGKEYPMVIFRIASYPLLSLASPENDDYALLTVTMELDRETVKEFSLNRPPI